MGVLKSIFPVSAEELRLIKINEGTAEAVLEKSENNCFRFDKFIKDYYLMFHYAQMSSVVENILESGVYIEDKQNYFLELRYISPTKTRKILAWANRVSSDGFKKYSVGYERMDNYGNKITAENYLDYYDKYITGFIAFIIKNAGSNSGLLLVSV